MKGKWHLGCPAPNADKDYPGDLSCLMAARRHHSGFVFDMTFGAGNRRLAGVGLLAGPVVATAALINFKSTIRPTGMVIRFDKQLGDRITRGA